MDRDYEEVPAKSLGKSDLKRLLRRFSVRDQAAVQRFLVEHAFLAPLLTAAPDRISEHFSLPSLALEVLADPEGAGEELVLSILTDLEPEAALQRLDALDEAWWLDALAQAQGKLNIGLEFL